ncbi:hypothetical protein QYF36_013855 [Acer negundo]|nr:hypothetical protein QYF36_013855 [Acer negundo]
MLPKFDEPEVIDLAHFLNDSGACVYGAGTDKLLIKGKCHLHGSEYVVPPDRIEAGTFILAAAITRSITQFNHDTLEVSSMPSNVGDHMQGFDIKTEESVFEKRMSHVRELQKLGADIRVCGSTALVSGGEKGSGYGSPVVAADLRGGVSLVLAGLVVEGTTEIDGIAHIDHSYENLDTKLQLLEADIKRLIR